LIAIARSFGVNEFELAAYNGFTVIDVIRVGQVLRIPPAAPTDTGASGEDSAAPQPTPTFRRYVIVPGDTLSRVAARFNTSVRAIVELNNITNPNRILYGQIIRIPNE
jgi:LysM repeat protein